MHLYHTKFKTGKCYCREGEPGGNETPPEHHIRRASNKGVESPPTILSEDNELDDSLEHWCKALSDSLWEGVLPGIHTFGRRRG